MRSHPRPSPLTATELVDEYFIENRTKLLDIAAFLDRLDRTDPACARTDFRMRAFTDAVAALGSTGRAAAARVDAVQMLFSDPTVEPLEALDRKGAVGAFDPRGSRAAADDRSTERRRP
jgi:hypothetical protein